MYIRISIPDIIAVAGLAIVFHFLVSAHPELGMYCAFGAYGLGRLAQYVLEK